MSVFPELVLSWHPGRERNEYALEGGLTKRELFAAMAMQGLLANPAYADHGPLAPAAVFHADALLAELEKSK
jgi:hypothetical protein